MLRSRQSTGVALELLFDPSTGKLIRRYTGLSASCFELPPTGRREFHVDHLLLTS